MLEAHNPGNMFVTLFLALYDPQSGELSYANGGHCPPYIIDAASDAPPRMLDKLSGPLVGVIRDALLQAQIAGEVTDRASALHFVCEYARKSVG